jgi:AAA domain-containing protein
MSPIESAERDYSLSLKEGWFRSVNASARSQPALLTVDELRAMDDLERARYEEHRAVWHANLGPIATPRMQAVHADLDEIVEANRQDGDRVKGAAVIDAYPGLGKTTIAVSFGRAYHRRQMALYGAVMGEGHQRIPVAYIGLTSNTTMRSLNSMLCRFYGHPGADRGNATQLAYRATDCVFSCKTRLVIIDDVHFLDVARRDGREVANHLKWLANTFPVTFLFIGVGLRQRGLLTEGLLPGDAALAQTARRWTTLTVAPFEIATDEGRATWHRLLLSIERLVVLARKHRGMLADELAGYLYARSTGHFASLMTLIARGCRRAVRTSEERLTKELLDGVKNDEAAELARRELEAALDRGLLRVGPSAVARSGVA